MPTYRLINKSVQSNCLAMVTNLPLDGSMEVVVREYKKPSSAQQRRRMFGYVVSEIAQQAFFNGKQYPDHVWHILLKEMFLPECFTEGITKESYEKYVEIPDGSLRMVGSTLNLTTKGHTDYVTACEAWAAQELGVQFSAREI